MHRKSRPPPNSCQNDMIWTRCGYGPNIIRPAPRPWRATPARFDRRLPRRSQPAALYADRSLALDQDAPQQLARGRFRQLIQELDRADLLVRRDPPGHEG